MKRLRITVPASSANLGPGFDSLAMALDITDVFNAELDPTSDDVVVDEATCRAAGVRPEDHYVCRAYRSWATDAGIKLPGARFTLERRIPIGKGLGSSAAAIVAGLAAAARASDETDPRDRILRLAASMEGHPDNSTAAAIGGITTAFVDGPDVRALHVVNHITLGVALFVPDEPLPTVDARAVLPTQVSVADAVFNVSRAGYLATALVWGRWDCIGRAMHDRLHQPYRARLVPALDDVIAAARAGGAYGAALSGGGPAVLALGPRERAAEFAASMEACACDRGWRGSSMVTQIRAAGVDVGEA